MPNGLARPVLVWIIRQGCNASSWPRLTISPSPPTRIWWPGHAKFARRGIASSCSATSVPSISSSFEWFAITSWRKTWFKKRQGVQRADELPSRIQVLVLDSRDRQQRHDQTPHARAPRYPRAGHLTLRQHASKDRGEDASTWLTRALLPNNTRCLSTGLQLIAFQCVGCSTKGKCPQTAP